jgi:hypothetical protein
MLEAHMERLQVENGELYKRKAELESRLHAALRGQQRKAERIAELHGLLEQMDDENHELREQRNEQAEKVYELLQRGCGASP